MTERELLLFRARMDAASLASYIFLGLLLAFVVWRLERTIRELIRRMFDDQPPKDKS